MTLLHDQQNLKEIDLPAAREKGLPPDTNHYCRMQKPAPRERQPLVHSGKISCNKGKSTFFSLFSGLLYAYEHFAYM